ncbi:MAG: lamin tail domain-containing protein, partial [Patescibacteria group bacterium]|nr:lamin tail domain-containing protein [Patescibacteria group bacterium]
QIINLNSANFLFISNESNSTFDCSLDDNGWEICVTPRDLIDLSDSSHIFKVRARDASNNIDQTPAEHSWTIDTVAPQIIVVSGPPDISSSTIANFQFNSSEDDIGYQCQLDANPWQTCSASTSVADLIEGSHSLEVKSADQAGNTGSSTLITWLVDLTAPVSAMASLEAAYETAGFTVSWSGEDADAVGATTTASGLADFDAQYKIGAGDWQDWINATTSTSTIFNLAVASGQTVYFHARARDLAGNLGDWSESAQTAINDNSANHLVISEVQTGGTTANDFIELYNPTDADINLSDYSIQYRGGGAHTFEKKDFLSDSVIKAKKYFLIASSEYAGSTSADFSVSFSLTASGGTIFIANTNDKLDDNSAISSVVIDRLAYGSGDHLFPEGTAWPTAPLAGQSLERKATATSTAETMAAGGAHAASGNGYDSNNNNNDFILKNIPAPQSTVNSSEPRSEISLGLNHLWHFDECEGASLNDVVGSDNLPQNAIRVVGKWQCAVNQSWQAQHNIEKTFSVPLSAGELTYSFYWRNSSWPNEGRNYIYFKTAADQIAAGIRPSIYTRDLYFNGLATSSIPAMPNDNNWHMITAAYGQNGLALYIDGAQKAFFAGDYTIVNPITGLEMKGENWPVDMDEIAIWSRALGSDEIADIYNSNAPLEPYAPPTQPNAAERVHWWHFDEGTGATADDSVGDMSLSPIIVWTGGKINGGIEHTWADGYEINKNLMPEINSKDLSIDFWWQNSAYPNEGRVSLELQNSTGAKIFGLRPSIYSGNYYFDGGQILSGDIFPHDNAWHHLALVYDSYNFYLYLYVDGVEKIKVPKVWYRRPITKLVIRGENWSYKLDELAIWQGALTAGQVQNIYQGN